MADKSRNDRRLKRHARVRKHVFGTPEKPRMCVFRSNANISVQIIDDVNGKTLVSASSLDKDLKKEIGYGGNKESATAATRKLLLRSAKLSQKRLQKRASRKYASTEADISSTAESRNSLMLHVKPDWISKGGYVNAD